MAEREYSSTDVTDEDREGSDLSRISFTLDGERFTCQGWANALEQSELAMAWEEAELDPNSPAGIALMARFLRVAFGPAEYRRLRRHYMTHNTPISVQVKIVAGLNEEIEAEVARQAGRPTRRPRSSSAGRGDQAARTSRVISLQHGTVREVDPEGLDIPPAQKTPGRRRRSATG